MEALVEGHAGGRVTQGEGYVSSLKGYQNSGGKRRDAGHAGKGGMELRFGRVVSAWSRVRTLFSLLQFPLLCGVQRGLPRLHPPPRACSLSLRFVHPASMCLSFL